MDSISPKPERKEDFMIKYFIDLLYLYVGYTSEFVCIKKDKLLKYDNMHLNKKVIISYEINIQSFKVSKFINYLNKSTLTKYI
jgi:hypothetical protein